MKWIKPNGTEIETNDMKATVEYCKSLGWKERDRESTKEESERDASLARDMTTEEAVAQRKKMDAKEPDMKTMPNVHIEPTRRRPGRPKRMEA